MTLSFRFRVFVLATMIVGVVLGAVMVVGWSSVQQLEGARLNDRLCMEARRLATQPFRAEALTRLEADVALKLRLGSAGQLLLRVDAAGGPPPIASAGWRDAPDPDSLNWAAAPRRDARNPPDDQRPERSPGPPDRTLDTAPDSLPGPPPGDHPGEPNRERQSEASPPHKMAGPEGCGLASFRRQGDDWRAARYTAGAARSVLAADLTSSQAELQSAAQRALLWVVPLALLLTAVGAWVLASLTTQPVNRLALAMKQMTPQALDQRLPSEGEDREFKALIGDYNTMLARLEVSFHQASRFSADAAHELKTPLTILQGRLELAIGRADNRMAPAELTGMLDEVGRLAAITRKLLLLSQADAGQLALHTTPVDVTELLDALVADAHMLIASQTISAAIARGLVACGDSALLRQLLNNLLSNAVRYSLPTGAIRIEGRALLGGVEVVFANPTVPIEAVHRARFFERFFRGDPAHNRAVEGSGLGLSLSRELARAHGGDLTLEPSEAGEVRMRLWLPQRRT